MKRAGQSTRTRRAAGLLTVSLVLAGLALAHAPAAGAATPLGTATLTMYSEGEYVGGGIPREFDPTNATFSGTADLTGISISASGGTSGAQFQVTIAPPAGTGFKIGTYTGAQRTPFRSAGRPGIDIYGDGRGCNNQGGSFEIRDLASSGSTITRLDLLYEQHCENGPAALFGELRIGEPKPAAAVTSTANIVWPTVAEGGQGLPVPVYVRNPSASPVTLGSVSLAGFNPGDFRLSSDSCSGQSLGAGASCTTFVQFKPTTNAPRTAILAISIGPAMWNIQLDGMTRPGVTSFSMTSQPGDYIGAGGTYNYTSGVSVTGGASGVHGGVSFGGDSWYIDMVPASGSVIQPGTFANATRYPFNGAGNGLSIYGNGRGCNTLTGSFTVLQASFSAVDNSLQNFDATFVQHCEGGVPALTGELKFNAAPVIAPFAPVSGVAGTDTANGTTVTWTNPGNASYRATVVRVQPGTPREPQPIAGTAAYTGIGTSIEISGLAPTTTYTVTIFTADQYGNLSPPVQFVIHPGPVTKPPARYTALSPTRVVDTRTTNVPGGWPAGAALKAGESLTIPFGSAGVPADATAVVLNLTATNVSEPTFITAYPAGVAQPTASNLNVLGGETRPNLVTVALGSGGAVSIANANGSVHIVADLEGYYAPNTEGGYAPISPKRVLDTRTGPVPTGWTIGSPVGADRTLNLRVRGVGGVPADATSVFVNITAADPTAASFVTAFPTGESLPNASNLNIAAGHIVSNAAIVKIGQSGEISLRNLAGSTHLIVDVNAAFGPGGTGAFVATSPTRLLDTRTTNVPSGWAPGTKLGPGQVLSLPVANVGSTPFEATAVAINLTGTNSTVPTVIAAYPTGLERPLTSNVNLEAAETRANLVGATLGNGAISFYNDIGYVDLVVDMAGFYVPS